MRALVADTNVIFLFSKNPDFIELVEKLRKSGVKLITPQFCLDELLNTKVKGDLMKYAGFSEKEFELFAEEVKKVFFVVPKFLYNDFMEEAKRISPDKKDVPLFALSLAFGKTPIWSREPRLKRQKLVSVLDNKGVEEMLKQLE